MLPSLKLTASLPMKIEVFPIGKDRIPTIHFLGAMLVSGRVLLVSKKNRILSR